MYTPKESHVRGMHQVGANIVSETRKRSKKRERRATRRGSTSQVKDCKDSTIQCYTRYNNSSILWVGSFFIFQWVVNLGSRHACKFLKE